MSIIQSTLTLQSNLNNTSGYSEEAASLISIMPLHGMDYAERFCTPSLSCYTNYTPSNLVQPSETCTVEASGEASLCPAGTTRSVSCPELQEDTSSSTPCSPSLPSDSVPAQPLNSAPPSLTSHNTPAPAPHEQHTYPPEAKTVVGMRRKSLEAESNEGAMPFCFRVPRSVCSCLSPGQAFEGTQNAAALLGSPFQLRGADRMKDEAWRVKVRLQGCDLDQGYICGSMEAINVPSAKSSVVTFWEGEIIDNVNHTFYSKNWGAKNSTDIEHWSKFRSFAAIRDAVEGGKAPDMTNYPFVFMRWKEKCFVNVGPDCGLTIAGFYYICFCIRDSTIEGYYYDPNSSPFQRLFLYHTKERRGGQSMAAYSFR